MSDAYERVHGRGPGEDLVPVGLRINPTLGRLRLLRYAGHGNYRVGPEWADRAGRALHDLPLRAVDYERVVSALLGSPELQAAVLSAWDLAGAAGNQGGHSTPRREQEEAVRALLRQEVPDAVPRHALLNGCNCCPCKIVDRPSCKRHDSHGDPWNAEDERRVFPRGRGGPCGVHVVREYDLPAEGGRP